MIVYRIFKFLAYFVVKDRKVGALCRFFVWMAISDDYIFGIYGISGIHGFPVKVLVSNI